MVLEKTLESPLDCKEIKPVNPEGNQSWIFIGKTYAYSETPVWPHDVKNWLSGKDPDAGKDRRQEEKGMTEDEMVGWHHQFDGHEFEQALGVGKILKELPSVFCSWLFCQAGPGMYFLREQGIRWGRVQALLVLLFLQRFSHLKKRNNSLGCGKLFVNFHSYKQIDFDHFYWHFYCFVEEQIFGVLLCHSCCDLTF